MLDEKDLQAIAKLISDSEARMTARMAEEISASEARMTARMAEEISASEARTAEKISASETQLKDYVDKKVPTAQSHMQALMEGYFDPKFELLGEKIDLLEEKMVTFEDLEDIESRLDALEIVTQQNVREIEKLKKAQ